MILHEVDCEDEYTASTVRMMGKEAAVAYSEIIYQNLPGGTAIGLTTQSLGQINRYLDEASTSGPQTTKQEC